jgi:hypothetical protein
MFALAQTIRDPAPSLSSTLARAKKNHSRPG